jgi:MarR family 2-MHQ and catechol resistance regulon transcriptional repressor
MGKTDRAFGAYVDLMDAADRLREEVGGHLESFDLTKIEFRVLETLYRHGSQYQQALSRKFKCSKQNIGWVLRRLEEQGRVRRRAARLRRTSPAKWANPGGAAKMMRPPGGRRIVLVRLTAEGRRVVEYIYPWLAKLVKAEMRVLDGREQQTLSRLCQKVREGNAVKLVKELLKMDAEEES